jgi:hypothetical protein
MAHGGATVGKKIFYPCWYCEFFCLLKALQLILDRVLLDHHTTLFNLDLCKVESFHYINNLFVCFVVHFNKG